MKLKCEFKQRFPLQTTLSQKFSIHLNGKVWNTIPLSNGILFEIRNEDTQSTEIGLLDGWDMNYLPLPEKLSWWSSAVYFTSPYILFQTIRDQKNPEHKSLWVWDCEKQEILWEEDNLLFVSVRNTVILAEKKEGESFVLRMLDLKTGTPAGDSDFHTDDSSPALLYPSHFSQDHAYFKDSAKFLREMLNVEPHLAVDYLEWDDRVFISFYIRETEGFTNQLSVWDLEGNLLLLEGLESQLKLPAMSSFLVWKDLLIFVKEKVILSGYKLRF
jgi:hypothetical protein